MGVGQRLGDLTDDPDRIVQRELLLPLEPAPQRLPLDERHDVVQQPAGVARVVERQDIGVLEVGGDLDLAQEPVGPDRSGQLRPEDLDGDLAAVPEVLGEEHRGHAAFAEQPLDVVAVAEGRAKMFQNVSHLRPRDSAGKNLPR